MNVHQQVIDVTTYSDVNLSLIFHTRNIRNIFFLKTFPYLEKPNKDEKGDTVYRLKELAFLTTIVLLLNRRKIRE